jgi:hypothetical protein
MIGTLSESDGSSMSGRFPQAHRPGIETPAEVRRRCRPQLTGPALGLSGGACCFATDSAPAAWLPRGWVLPRSEPQRYSVAVGPLCVARFVP